MRRHNLATALFAFAPVLVATVAKADRIETPEQLHPAGASVNLPGIGAQVTLPPAPGGWSLLLATEGTNKYDVVRRQDPTNPLLTVEFNRPKVANCAQLAAAYDKLIGAGLKLTKNATSSLAPMSFAPWSYELPAAPGKSTQKLCTNTPNGPVLASVGFEGPSGAIDPGAVQPLLDEVARAVGGTRDAVGGGPTMGGDALAGTVMLPASNVRIKLPDGWKTSTMPDKRAISGLADIVERPAPGLFFIISRVPNKCLFTPTADAKLVADKPYIPPGFRSESVELPSKNGGWIIVLHRPVANGCVIVGLSTMTLPDDPLVTETSLSVLSPIAASEGGSAGSSGLGMSDDSGGSSGSSGGGSSSAAGYYQVGIVQLSPEHTDQKSLAVSLGLDIHAYAGSGSGRGYAELAGTVGAGAHNFVPWDGRIGIGGGFGGGGFSLVGIVGIGGDGIGGKDDTFKMNGAAYWYFGGRLGFHAGTVGLAAGVTLHNRFGEQDVKKENRFFGRLTVSKFAFDIVYLQYKLDNPITGDNSPAASALGFYIGYSI